MDAEELWLRLIGNARHIPPRDELVAAGDSDAGDMASIAEFVERRLRHNR